MSEPEQPSVAISDPLDDAMEIDKSDSTAPEGMIVIDFFNNLL